MNKDRSVTNALDTLPFLHWLSGPGGEFEYISPAWFVVTGRAPQSSYENNWIGDMHPGDGEQFMAAYQAAFKAREKFCTTCRIKVGNAYKKFITQGSPRVDQEGKFAGYAGIFTEDPVTNGAPVQEEIAQLKETIARVKHEQERNNAELESFTYIASHDLQEPLRKIQSFSKMIMARDLDNLSDSAKDYFGRIMVSVERMQRLIDDLLSYSSTRVTAISFEPTDLNEVLTEVKASFQEVIEEKKAEIISGPLPSLPVIKFQLNQLFTNILANALKFTRPDLPVRISVAATIVDASAIHTNEEVQAGDYWQISFEDNGIGFEQQYENRIFELFQRLHGKNEYVGTGIGLAICKKIVHNHKGYITAIGRPGEGSVFNIYLPVSR